MFGKTAPYYDLVHAWKDYGQEAKRLLAILSKAGGPRRGTLLDVACGTGMHLERLRRRFTVEGVDASEGMLRVARRRLPRVPFRRGDMRTLDLGRTFDVVTCLFGSVGYMRTVADLRRAIAAMARHVAPGGALLVEPWFSPAEWRVGYVHGLLREAGGTWIARMNVCQRRGSFSVMRMHHLVGTPRGVRHVVEEHTMRLFAPGEYREAIRRAGLRPTIEHRALSGRGLWIGRRAPTPDRRT